jgi:L-asparagine oxygenase
MSSIGISPTQQASIEGHAPVPVVQFVATEWNGLGGAGAVEGSSVSEALVRSAGHAVRSLPEAVFDALSDFAVEPGPSGALLLRGVPVGALPATPPSPRAASEANKSLISEHALLTIARLLGQPVGYLPEHGGDLVQNIVPVADTQHRQVSTSSRVELMFHTEAAFHPHRPRYLLLLCLRGDAAAATTLCSVRAVLPHLDATVVDTLFEPRFRTRPDESYLTPSTDGRVGTGTLGAHMSVLSGRRNAPSMVFDADLMVGIDAEANHALHAFAAAVSQHRTAVVLEAGDLLVVDNTVAVHGRSPFTPRFDGTDRWLQRTFVVADLMPSAAERVGRIIATRFN